MAIIERWISRRVYHKRYICMYNCRLGSTAGRMIQAPTSDSVHAAV